MANKYNHQVIDKKWQAVWEKEGIYKAKDFEKEKKKFYILVEFPYASGLGLHIGHAFTNTIGDILARYERMNGKNVMYPMGWDSFGLPTENSAIKLKINPSILTKRNTKQFKVQNVRLGMSFDWNREIDTSNPNYYKWTQWIFLQLYKKGLAYKADTLVGWCPSCKIILANEEIVSGKCERCGSEITYRKQKQWLLKITAYADRLADELDLVDYPDYVKKSQRDWIGRKVWTDINYQIEGLNQTIVVSTTRPDTNFGATFVVLAPEHPLLSSKNITSKYWKDIERYIKKSKQKSELERISETGAKTGVFTGLYAFNQLTGSKMPIYVTDFVLMSVGTGAVVGVPGHDKRDFAFAKKFNLPIKRVVVGKRGDCSEIFTEDLVEEGEGKIINSDFLNGLSTKKATDKIIAFLEEKGWGRKVIRYHLRDWIFSRQHYWGEPIPIIYCRKCWETQNLKRKAKKLREGIDYTTIKAQEYIIYPVPEQDLPVNLPEVKNYQPTETGESPLSNIRDWVKVKCPKCGGVAQRETDTMPNWAGSSWYYLRYCDSQNRKLIADDRKLDYWQPVDVYIGGAEHTTLHLLYSRFWHKFLNDLHLIPGKEPYASRRQHGVILGEDGYRMSKSRGNIVNPVEMIDKFGADSLRLYLMFMGPYDSTMSWTTSGIEGMYRFISRLWRLLTDEKFKKLSKENEKDIYINMHQTIKKVSEDIQNLHYNTAISQLMTFINKVEENGVDAKIRKNLCLLFAPFAPHMMEEVWQTKFVNMKQVSGSMNQETGIRHNSKFKIHDSGFQSVHLQPWPKYDSKLIETKKITIVIQINGKVRSQIIIGSDQSRSKENIERVAKKDEKVKKWLKQKRLKKTIFVPGKLINFVI